MRERVAIGHRSVSSRVKVVHRGTIVFGVGETSKAATIPAIVQANSVLYLMGIEAAGSVGPFTNILVKVTVSATTTITATREDGNESDAITVGYTLVEYWPGVLRQVTRGTIVVNNTATIPSVDLARAILCSLGFTNTNTGTVDGFEFPRVALTSSVQVTGSAGTPNSTIGYQVFSE